MSHFEEFDHRKAVAAARADTGEERDASLDETGRFPLQEEERRLREALWALNRTIVPDMPETHEARIRRIRDGVWELGVELYGWSE